MLYVLGGYLLGSAFLLYVMLRGRNHKGGPVRKLYDVLSAAPRFLGCALCTLLCCSRTTGVAKYDALADRLSNRRHPVMQIVYITVLWTALACFFWDVVPTLNETNRLLSVVFSFITTASFFLASQTDPGVVTPAGGKEEHGIVHAAWEQRQNARFAADGALYQADAACYTCDVPRPARSKHCRICGHCVRRFDHHCVWLNCDVGENNIRFFHFYLLQQVSICIFVAMHSCYKILLFVVEQDLWNANYRLKDGKTAPATTSMIFFYSISHNAIAAGLVVFTVLMGLVLGGFWLSHLYNALVNRTSNEIGKLEDLGHFLSGEVWLAKKQEEDDAARANGEAVTAPHANCGGCRHCEMAPKMAGAFARGAAGDDAPMTHERAAQEYQRAEAFYGNGLLANVKEICFPNLPVRDVPKAAPRAFRAAAAAAAAAPASAKKPDAAAGGKPKGGKAGGPQSKKKKK
jgi:palmitoyltransferase